jgi:hypothetical protein
VTVTIVVAFFTTIKPKKKVTIANVIAFFTTIKSKKKATKTTAIAFFFGFVGSNYYWLQQNQRKMRQQ